MKKVLLSSFVILSTCLSQNGMCSNILDDEKNTSSPTKISSKEDELSLIIDTVNKIQTFLVTEKESLKDFEKLQKESLQKIAFYSQVSLMKEFRTDPLSFIENIQKRKGTLKKNPSVTIETIGEPLYHQTLAGLNMVNHILNSFDD